jgi:fatty-acyl-CoA synthase
MNLTPADRVCVPVPFYHCFGMVISNLASITHGSTIVIPSPSFDPKLSLEAVEKERCTVLHGVPTMFISMLEEPTFDQHDLSTLRTGIMAGAPCPVEVMRSVVDRMHMPEVLIAYGQTEASPAATMTRVDDTLERRVTTVGRVMPHQELKIVDPERGTTVARGEPGEICFRGYHVMQGYFEQPAATREAIDEHGWLHSGDLGIMDDDGYVRITGRLKEMIIRGGENIYPAEIEAYFMTHPKVVQAAVFGIPDERWGEEVGAWIELREGETATPDELRDFAANGLAHYKKPRYLKIVQDFPMTVTGKIQKFRIREMVEHELSTA